VFIKTTSAAVDSGTAPPQPQWPSAATSERVDEAGQFRYQVHAGVTRSLRTTLSGCAGQSVRVRLGYQVTAALLCEFRGNFGVKVH